MESTSRPTNGPTSTQTLSLASFEMSSHSLKMTAWQVEELQEDSWATSDAETTPRFFMAFISFFFMAGAAGAAAFFVAFFIDFAILVCFKQRHLHSWHTPSRHILVLQPPGPAFRLSRMSCCCFCNLRHSCSSRTGNVQSSSKTGFGHALAMMTKTVTTIS